MKYEIGDKVAVETTYEETELYTNSDGVLDTRVVGSTSRVVADIIVGENGDDSYFCKIMGVVGVERLSKASEPQIAEINSSISAAKNAIKRGEDFMNSLNEPEYI